MRLIDWLEDLLGPVTRVKKKKRRYLGEHFAGLDMPVIVVMLHVPPLPHAPRPKSVCLWNTDYAGRGLRPVVPDC